MSSRKCPNCGKMHDTVLENRESGEILDEFPTCYDCILATSAITHPISHQIYIQPEKNESFDCLSDMNSFISLVAKKLMAMSPKDLEKLFAEEEKLFGKEKNETNS